MALWKTSKSLIERVSDDCETSWREFYRAYRGFVVSIAMKSGIPEGYLDDFAQLIFLEIQRDLSKEDCPTFHDRSFSAWLGQKVKWRIIEYHRHRYRREYSTDPSEIPEMNTGTPFDELWQNEWSAKVLQLAMERSQEKPRNLLIFQALAIHEIPIMKVCEDFGISRSNADTIKKRVKDKLLPIVKEIETGEI